MLNPSLALILALSLAAGAAAAPETLGQVTKVLRTQVRTCDEKGQPLGQVAASTIKTPTPIVGYGVGHSIGISLNGKTVYLRGLDVLTDSAKGSCAPVQAAARPAGSAYAASNMGLGGAADCKPAAK
jgi:hypothetical protein